LVEAGQIYGGKRIKALNRGGNLPRFLEEGKKNRNLNKVTDD
jgi:hypothetical protein